MKLTMTVMSRMFATKVETTFIWSLSSCENPQMMPATKAHMPPSVSSKVLLRRLIF